MDVLLLVDRLDDMVRGASSGRLGAHVRLERQEAYALLDEMRRTIPEEIRQARYITQAREEMLDEARIEAARVLEHARAERSCLTGPGEVRKLAEQRAERILEGGRARARQIRLGAEGYADGILGSLETGFARLVDAGRAER